MPDATERLRTDILSGEFQPGTRLVELALAERYGVGRAAIRASFVALGAQGLVVHEANRGATVKRIPVGVAIEIAEARAVLEGLLARHAAQRATNDERSELQRLIEDMESSVANSDQETYSQQNRRLHRRIREISRHSIGSELAANLRHRAAHQEFQLSQQAGRSSLSVQQHRAIVEAIIGGDGAAAEQAMHAHLESVEDALRSWAV